MNSKKYQILEKLLKYKNIIKKNSTTLMLNGSCKKEKWKLVVIFYGLKSWIDNENNTRKAVMEWSNGMKNDSFKFGWFPMYYKRQGQYISRCKN